MYICIFPYTLLKATVYSCWESIIAQWKKAPAAAAATAEANAQLICMHCHSRLVFSAALQFVRFSNRFPGTTRSSNLPSPSSTNAARTMKPIGERGNSSLGNCKSRQAQSTNWQHTYSATHTQAHAQHMCVWVSSNWRFSNTPKLYVCKNTVSSRNKICSKAYTCVGHAR